MSGKLIAVAVRGDAGNAVGKEPIYAREESGLIKPLVDMDNDPALENVRYDDGDLERLATEGLVTMLPGGGQGVEVDAGWHVVYCHDRCWQQLSPKQQSRIEHDPAVRVLHEGNGGRHYILGGGAAADRIARESAQAYLNAAVDLAIQSRGTSKEDLEQAEIWARWALMWTEREDDLHGAAALLVAAVTSALGTADDLRFLYDFDLEHFYGRWASFEAYIAEGEREMTKLASMKPTPPDSGTPPTSAPAA